ncbi:hypothetical protein Bca4012_051528 [Brassica carinata]
MWCGDRVQRRGGRGRYGFSDDGGGMEFYGGAGRSILGYIGTVIKSDIKIFNRRLRTRFPDSQNIPRLDRRLVIWWE